MVTYAVKLARRYDGLYIATFPDVPDAVAYGRDDEEAIEEAGKALEASLQRCIKDGRELPAARTKGTLGVSALFGEAALA